MILPFVERAARALATSHGNADDWREYVDAVKMVLGEIAPALKDGKIVAVPGVGILRVTKKRKWLQRPVGLKRGFAREDRVVQLQHPAVLEQGERYEV